MFYELAGCIVKIKKIMPLKSGWQFFKREGSFGSQNIIVISEGNQEVTQKNKEELDELAISALDEKIYCCCVNTLIIRSVLHLHSSFVLYNGQAILFTGPSGIGKTTQAELWRDYEDAVIVNGDVTLIRKIDDVWRAFGAPIHGSSPYCENMDAPIAAIIVLKQAEENQLIQLDAFTALGECFPEIYRPEMSDETYEILLDTVDALLSEIPVYQLSCRPDRESVELVKQTLFDQNPEL